MGEIADALRRARSGGLLPSDPPAPAEPGPDAAGPRRPESPPGQPVAAEPKTFQQSHPTDRAIVKTQGAELEACRQLALKLRIELERRGVRSVAIVSALRAEGKTTTSCNLALALASLASGRSVALVDLDLRKPSITRVLGIDAQVGIERYLAGSASLDEVRVAIDQSSLDVYPAVTPQRSAHEMLTRGPLGGLVSELERRYEVVLIDTPPTLLVPDARLILGQVAVCVPVARAGTTRVRAFRELVGALPTHQILSTLLNGKRGLGGYYQGYDYSDSIEAEKKQPRGRAPRRRSRRTGH